jgi:hypothetical protein
MGLMMKQINAAFLATTRMLKDGWVGQQSAQIFLKAG